MSMVLFETKRLIVKTLEKQDKAIFIELLSDPLIINPIPQPQFSIDQIEDKFEQNLSLIQEILITSKFACGVFKKGNHEMIGLSLFLINDENDREIGYRFRVNHWGKGFGTELAKGMINFCFDKLNLNKVTADVNIDNSASVKILDNLMVPVREFYNKEGDCIDRRYIIEKGKWKQTPGDIIKQQ